jgi:hypothetical protein
MGNDGSGRTGSGEKGRMSCRACGGYRRYRPYYVYRAGGPPGNPLRFDTQVQPNGDFQGTTTLSTGLSDSSTSAASAASDSLAR